MQKIEMSIRIQISYPTDSLYRGVRGRVDPFGPMHEPFVFLFHGNENGAGFPAGRVVQDQYPVGVLGKPHKTIV